MKNEASARSDSLSSLVDGWGEERERIEEEGKESGDSKGCCGWL